ncbi:SURF1 family protein [Demequina sp. NBRC 110051]|uniref:SURF1 family protein n=1 Tax=Demequina sp. NBRC 110051 TaxID=1570340 RepID=UPI000A02D8CC|nr:SURF1 family protein [Demequina sp. NBRC 110051]
MPRRPSLARIALTMLVALAVSAVAIMLGFWQLHRHQFKADAVAAYDAAAEAPVADLDEVIPPGSDVLPDDAEWRTVTVTGTFEQDTTTILRGRPIDSTAAWQFLAWLDTDDGRSVLVSAGWIEQPGPNEDPELPTYPDGEVTVTGIVRAWEEDDGKEATSSVSRITPSQLEQPAGEMVPGYLMIREACDGGSCAETLAGAQVPLPDISTGPHLSYAVQWWIFAALAPIGAVLLLRRDAEVEGDTTEPAAARAPREPRRSGRGRRAELSDEEIEDAL